MNKPTFIHRKDHETYFLEITAAHRLYGKKLRAFVESELQKVHPGFSSSDVFHVMRVRTKTKNWLAVTVMTADNLNEYRFVCRGHNLVTATTAILAHPDFLSSGTSVYDGEVIGYDEASDSPVSLPSATERTTASTHRIDLEAAARNPAARVFARRLSRVSTIAAVVLAIIVLVPFIGMMRSGNEAKIDTRTGTIPDSDSRMSIPCVFQVLNDISTCILSTDARILSFECAETDDTSLLLGLRGSNPVILRGILETIPYLKVREVTGVTYEGGVQEYFMRCGYDTASFRIPPVGETLDEFAVLKVLSAVDAKNEKENLPVVSQSVEQSGGNAISIAFEVSEPNLLRLIANVFSSVTENAASSTRLAVSHDRTGRQFFMRFEIREQSSPEDAECTTDILDASNVLEAFGVRGIKNGTTKRTTAMETIPEGYVKIGKISDKGTDKVFYRNADGKILTREEQ